MSNFRNLHVDAIQAEEQLLAKIIEERMAVFEIDETLREAGPLQNSFDEIDFTAIQICVRYAAWSIRRSLAESQLLEEQINGVS